MTAFAYLFNAMTRLGSREPCLVDTASFTGNLDDCSAVFRSPEKALPTGGNPRLMPVNLNHHFKLS